MICNNYFLEGFPQDSGNCLQGFAPSQPQNNKYMKAVMMSDKTWLEVCVEVHPKGV